MGFFDIGPIEILLILIVALIIWGPGKIPEIARTLGKTVRAFRKATSDLTTEVTRELSIEEEKEKKDHLPPSRANRSNEAQEPLDVKEAESSNTEVSGQRDQ